MKGYRKLIIVLLAFGIAALVKLNEFQANVIIWIGMAAIAGNSVEHLKDLAGGIRGVGANIGSAVSKLRREKDAPAE